ncbi:MAG: ThuA domain-containing protein [Opitutaceae bacterium]|nr:ThuA domain-containing protein [Verrucomicrobiales bacterium]
MKHLYRFLLVAAILGATVFTTMAAHKQIVLVAGTRSHGPGEHEHNAGVQLLAKCLEGYPGIQVRVHLNGWPTNASAFDGADTIMLYMDGGGGHPALKEDRLAAIDALMKKGVGFVAVHYAVEVLKEKGGPQFLEWMGGYFEPYFSVNPHWEAEFKEFPDHPVTRGVKPFKIRDEWYYHMRFVGDMKGVTAILTAVPPDSTRGRPGSNSIRGGNPEVQKHMGEPEHMAWAYERPNGGRGFGFTGAHFHKNWGDDSFRKLVLNSLLWTAKMDVPKDGVTSTVSPDDLLKNLDPKGRPRIPDAPLPATSNPPPVAPTSPASAPK